MVSIVEYVTQPQDIQVRQMTIRIPQPRGRPEGNRPGSATEERLRSIRVGTRIDTVEARIRQYIIESALQPGDRLPSEAHLAAQLGGSRVVIREALGMLEALGVLEARVGAGWFVRPFDVGTTARTFARSLTFHPNALLDLFAVRNATEAELVVSIAGRIGPEDLAALDDLAAQMAGRAAAGHPFTVEDSEFHRRLIAFDGNLIALTLVDLFFGVMDVLYRQDLAAPAVADLPAIALAHQQIVSALRRRDGQEARHAMILSNNDGRRRLTHWRDAHAGTAQPGARHPLELAVQSALLWPDRDQPRDIGGG